MNRVLVVADTIDWAIASLVRPLKKLGVDLAYHYINTTKNTGTGEKNPTHLTIDLLKNYDQIHFHTARAVDSMLKNKEIVDILKDKRLIMTIHTEREDDLKLIKEKYWDLINTYISPTKYQQEKVKEYTGKDPIYIPHAIDEKKYSFTKDYPPKEVVIGYVGRIVPHKCLKTIVEASGGLQVAAIGYVDNEGHDYWRSIPKDNLRHYQNLTEDEKIEIMKKFTVLVSISEPHIEVGPLPVIECAALGIPIITTVVGWAKDMLPGYSAYFYHDFNVKEPLMDLIKLAIEDEAGREENRKNARKVIDSWTLEDYINAHRKVYENK